MSKLNVDQKTIKQLFTDNSPNFLIPDYQRPYAWEDDECQTLWDDIFNFALPENNVDLFVKGDEYFLGAIVTFKNDDGKLEVIDGQQRLTTILLLLRAFYDRFALMNDQRSTDLRRLISQCIWHTDEFGNADTKQLKIDSEVATDDEKEEFLEILRSGTVSASANSKYVINFRFFQKKINTFVEEYPTYFQFLPARILNNCILLPIEADSQDTALRIFSTLNDRGLPLADADIFKAQFYKYYNKKNQKDEFIENWKSLTTDADEIFKPIVGTPMDELFTKYMYYIRASEDIKLSTTEALRKFYEHDNYRRLLKENTILDLLSLVKFWKQVAEQDRTLFSEKVLQLLFVLKYAPNSMWEYITSVYYFSFKDDEDVLNNDEFAKFLSKITAFIFAYALTNPGVNALRTPVYAEMIKLYSGERCTFENFRFDEKSVRNALDNYRFTNNRPITRSLITWYAFTFEDQELPPLNSRFQIEHIYASERHNRENMLINAGNLESLGNKILLERSINIRASDYRFEDKKKFYAGFVDARGKEHPCSMIEEYKTLIQQDDFSEKDILYRDKQIKDAFVEYLYKEDLIKNTF